LALAYARKTLEISILLLFFENALPNYTVEANSEESLAFNSSSGFEISLAR